MNESEYVLFVIEEKCNSKCNICCLESPNGPLIDLFTISMSNFKKFLGLLPEGKYSGIKFSGGEVTLNNQLAEYASYAKDKGFRNIMIQTNARALSDIRKAKQLKSAGINQFFVSFHAADNDLSDRITGRRGACAQTVKGLENLNKLGLMVITNTVMCSMNYVVLPETASFLGKFSNIVEMQFWVYSPLSLKADELLLPYGLAAPYLNETIKYLVSHRREVCVKYFPLCLLDDAHRKYLKNEQQPIDIGIKENWRKRNMALNFRKYLCCEGTNCRGLPEVYRSTMLPGNWMPSAEDRNAVNI